MANNNYNQSKTINRQKFNAICKIMFYLGKNDDWESNMKELRDDFWEELE